MCKQELVSYPAPKSPRGDLGAGYVGSGDETKQELAL